MDGSRRTSALATWALGLAVLFVVPLLPLLGAALGVVAWVRIRRSRGRLAGEGRALSAVGIGLVAGAVSFVAFHAVVMPGWVGLGARARWTNVEGNLRDVERALYRHHAARGRFPIGVTGWTPDRECCAGESFTCPRDPEEWTRDPIWAALDFVPRTAPAFQLRYRSRDGTSFVVEARGDVECDGTPESLRMKGRIGPSGGPKTDPIERNPEATPDPGSGRSFGLTPRRAWLHSGPLLRGGAVR